MNPDRMTPLEALEMLHRLRGELNH